MMDEMGFEPKPSADDVYSKLGQGAHRPSPVIEQASES
jgi:hypothetical protein